jgi:predicted metalloprotease
VKGGGLGVLLLALVGMYFGIDPSFFLQQNMQVQMEPAGQSTPMESPGGNNELSEFVAVVLADTEDVWGMLFQQMGRTYEEPPLVLFTGTVESACGLAQAASGPFYCPGDRKVYIDLAFYQDLKYRMNAPGDFAQAYVIAHEIGHHVQTLLGISGQVNSLRRRASKSEGNQLSVLMELQADCLAGVWSHHAHKMRNILEPGDIDEALNAASMIGDDRLQKQARGYVVPDSFTHGTSAQRVRWFRRGLETGNIGNCDSFSANRL